MIINNFKDNLKKHKIEITNEQILQFKHYFNLLTEWNQKMNLTAIIEEAAVYEKHFFDSLIIMEKLNFANSSLVDVGAGAGFPGIPLKILNPTMKLTIIEPNNKRCLFLQALRTSLKLENVVILNKRSEDVKNLANIFDFVCSRAVAKLSILLEITSFLAKPKGLIIAFKGRKFQEEIDLSKNAFDILNLKIKEIQIIKLWTNQDMRANIIIEKTQNSNLKYPRNFGQIKSNPL